MVIDAEGKWQKVFGTGMHTFHFADVVVAGGTTLKVTPSEVTIIGNLKVNGKIEATDDVIGKGISLATHTHTGDSGGSTSTPK